MDDLLDQLVILCQTYLSDECSHEHFRAKTARIMLQLNVNEGRSLAHLISQYAIHLRDRGH
jgi:hypothetical protein